MLMLHAFHSLTSQTYVNEACSPQVKNRHKLKSSQSSIAMAARRPTKMYTAQEVLAILQALPDVDSAGSEGDSFICESELIPTESSSDEDVPAPTDSQTEQPLPMRQTRNRTKKLIIVKEEEDEERSVKGKSSKLKQGKRQPENKPQGKKRRHTGEKSSSSQKRKRTEQKSQRKEQKAQKSTEVRLYLYILL